VINADDDQGLRQVPITGEGVTGIPAPSGGGWKLNGAAKLNGTTLVLTPATKSAIGAAFWPTPVAAEGLDINYDALIDSGSGADGLTLTLADPARGAAATSIGAGGGGLGFSGVPGIAVALDTYRNAVNPSNNFIGISDGAGSTADRLHWLSTSTNVPPLRTAPRHVRATFTHGVLAVSVDGVSVLGTNVTLPGSVLVGFTGACGGLYDRHAVTNVSISASPAPHP
jgi:hypothetical protein